MDIRYLAERAKRSEQARRRISREGRTPAGYRTWSSVEKAFLRKHYPDTLRIQSRFPHRTVVAIQAKASKLGLTKKNQPWTCLKILRLRKVWAHGSRDDIRRTFPEYSWQRLYGKASSLRLRRPSQQLPAKHPLIEEIRARGRRLGFTLTDIDQLTKSQSYFRNSIGKKNPHIDSLLRAIEALDGHIEIVWH